MSYQQKDITEALCAEFVDDLDLTKCFVYLFDIVHEDAIPLLAKQLNVDGYKGMDLANTVVQQREVLKNAYEIKKLRGTVYAIKQALSNCGFENVRILEGIESATTINLDGSHVLDGSWRLGGVDWAKFSVNVYVENPSLISDSVKESVRSLILYNKNARSVLVSVNYIDINSHFLDGTWILNGSVTI